MNLGEVIFRVCDEKDHVVLLLTRIRKDRFEAGSRWFGCFSDLVSIRKVSASSYSLHLGTATTWLLLCEEVALEVSGANGLDLSIRAVRSLTRTCRIDEDCLDDLTFLALSEALVQPVRRCLPPDLCLEVAAYGRDNLLDRRSLQHLSLSIHIVISSEKAVIFLDCLLMQRLGLFLP